MVALFIILQGISLALSTPLDDVAAAAKNNQIVPLVVPAINLTTRINISYMQPDGNYTYCGMYMNGSAVNFTLNDTGVTMVTPFQARSYRNVVNNASDYFRYVPDVAWNATPGMLYTLLMVDPLFILPDTSPFGPFVEHWMVININGSNMSTGQLINPLLGPGPKDPNYHKYVFVLYEHPQPLNLTANETAAIVMRGGFNLSTFLMNHNLTSAAGINWLYAMGDSWGAVEQDALGFSKINCFQPVEDAAKKNGIVPDVVPAVNLTTRLTVHYSQPAGSYINCEKTYNNTATNYSLNDTGVTLTTPWDARSYRPMGGGTADYFMYAPNVTWDTQPGMLYTLLMVDPIFILNATVGGPYVEHWMVININGSNISTGEVVNPLLGPAPVDPPNMHKYTLVLYTHQQPLVLSPEERGNITMRRGFNLTTFVDAHALGAASGLNWMYAMGDTWSPVVQDALGIRGLDCYPNVTAAAMKNDLVPKCVPSVVPKTRLTINYVQPDGNYSFCGSVSVFPAYNFTPDDMGATLVTPWNSRSFRNITNNASDYFRYQPSVQWTAVPGMLYTLIAVDPLFVLPSPPPIGPYVAHWLVININGSNITTGQTINPLLGPGPNDPNYHKYIFVLYAHAAPLTLSVNETADIQKRGGFNLTTFLMNHNLTSAVGINWFYAMGDNWGAVEQDALNFSKLDCFLPVENAAKANGIYPTVVPEINISTRLTVKFNQPAGTYVYCGTPTDNPAAMFQLDDTNLTIATPWNLRSWRPTPSGGTSDYFMYRPDVSWVPKPDTLYTVMMIDPVFVINDTHKWGPYVQHWMVINVPGNNISGGEEINPLLGPGPDEPGVYHKYTFVLYEQPDELVLSPAERAQITGRTGFSLSAFTAAHNLDGAVGLNWVFSMVDNWALVQLDALHFVSLDCFGAVLDTAKTLGIVPVIIQDLDLNTQLAVHYEVPEGSYVNCGGNYGGPAVEFLLSDTDFTKVYETPYRLRSYRATAGLNNTQRMYQYTPSITWAPETDENYYTLMMVDPIFIYNATDKNGPFISHMLEINIQGNTTTMGVVINKYLGPLPLDPLYHKYLFLLYRHQFQLDINATEMTQLQARVNFNLTAFVAHHGLDRPVGINWVFAMSDAWAAVGQDYAGFRPLVCPTPAPTAPGAGTDYIHLTPGAFAAICIVAGVFLLILLGVICVQRSQRRTSPGTAYAPLPGDGGHTGETTGRKSSVNRHK